MLGQVSKSRWGICSALLPLLAGVALGCGGDGVSSPPLPPTKPTTYLTRVLARGSIQVTLSWNTIDDLDLYVTDPTRQTVFYGNPSVPSGGQLDVDANPACSNVVPDPVENVFWASTPPRGTYLIEVRLYQRCIQSTDPIPFTVTVRQRGNVERTFSGLATSPGLAGRFRFSFPFP